MAPVPTLGGGGLFVFGGRERRPSTGWAMGSHGVLEEIPGDLAAPGGSGETLRGLAVCRQGETETKTSCPTL